MHMQDDSRFEKQKSLQNTLTFFQSLDMWTPIDEM
jgi:hypothetical protein